MRAPKLRIIVTGLIAQYPLGGVAWDYLHYVIGLDRLGHDVYYHEDTWCWPYHPLKKTAMSDGTYSAKFLDNFFRQYAPDLKHKWHYSHLHEKSFGLDQHLFDQVARTADVFLNVSGACTIPEHLSPHCVKVFLDTDPGYNQIMLSERLAWSENVERWCATVNAHDRYLTFAENIYGPDCLIPKMEYQWKTTRMPVVLDFWEHLVSRDTPTLSPWTTVMTWNAFKGKLIYENVEYKSKGEEFEKVMDLPYRTKSRFLVAVGGGNAPLKQLDRHGWQVVDGEDISTTPDQYQEFIAGSRGEFSPAKHVYVATRSGWFSCRSACYLAAGRPVVVQDTGFSSILPVGEGLVAFTNVEEAALAIHDIEGNYDRHRKAARAIAKEYFDSTKVLNRLIESVSSGIG